MSRLTAFATLYSRQQQIPGMGIASNGLDLDTQTRQVSMKNFIFTALEAILS